jgi:acyl-CoA thioester hydrolase
MSQSPHRLLADFPVFITTPVHWGEMDAYGHVNNAVYFRYFESARIAFLDACGFLETYDTEKVGAILHSTSCRFRQALRYPDTVQVGARATAIGDDRFTNEYRVVSLQHESVVAEGDGVIVAFDYTRRAKTALPKVVRAKLHALRSDA